MKRLQNSIRTINYLILFLITYINTLYIFIETFSKYKLSIFSINLLLLLLYVFVNRNFQSDETNSKKYIKEIIGKTWCNLEKDYIKTLLFKKLTYKENEDFYNLFKKVFVKKNIIEKDYKDLKEVFYKFIPEWLAKEIWETGTEKITPGISIKKNLNIMFLDIIWFTTITEKLTPQRALLLLNIYFDWIVEIIKQNDGYIDKFLWDGIMIIFDSNNSDWSVKASIEIQNYIKKFQINEVWRKISIWIWINSWDVIIGTIWSNKRMEMTAIWDTVNTASRIENMTRSSNSNILISESTYKKILNKELFNIETIWYKQLRWKKDKLKIYWVHNVLNMKL